MNYWKGLAIAAALDAAVLMGCPATSTGPDPLPPVEVVMDWPTAEPAAELAIDLAAIGHVEDSLMSYLQAHPEDVDAMQKLADVYTEHGWDDAAIGPLARALQLDPDRRSLWVTLDRVLEQGGRAKITDGELVQRAAAFVEAVEMWGHGC